MLQKKFTNNIFEAGCDEAGRGCLAGPVFAAAVILSENFEHNLLNDSKKASEKNRYLLRDVIIENAVSWAIGVVDNYEIDKINILNASIKAMHIAIDNLKIKPDFLIIDGNRFKKYNNTEHQTIVKGDGLFMSIAAASILAKTFRDDFMLKIHSDFPVYNWKKNKGYPTLEHRKAVLNNGLSKFHRKSFCDFYFQQSLNF